MSTNWESTIERLDAARSLWWLFSLLCGFVAAVSISLLALIIIVSLDAAIAFSSGVRQAFFWVWCLGSLGLMGLAIFRSVRFQRTRLAAARRIEGAFPHVENDLINLVQLAESDGGGSSSFRQAALAEAAVRTEFVPFDEVAMRYPRHLRWSNALHGPRDVVETALLLVAVLMLFSVISVSSPRWWNSVDRILSSTQEVQSVELHERSMP